MASAFLKITGIIGSAPEGYIEISSFSFGVSNSETPGAASGASAGKVSFSDLHITKSLDQSSAELFKSCVGGINLGNVLIKIVNGNESATYTLTDAAIAMYKLGDGFHKLTDGCADGSTASPGAVESISFNFLAISQSSG
jgi:type VI protein secretion system component Hcp